jgi:hypothetical protein
MKRLLLLSSVIAVFLTCPLCHAGQGRIRNASQPLESRQSLAASIEVHRANPGELKFVTQLPSELPQRVMGFTYDGEKLWAMIYQGRGRYATLNPSTLEWQISNSEEQHKAIIEVARLFQSPGGISFANGKLWVASSYGVSFGCIDTQNWKVTHFFNGKYREDRASQSYSGMAYDGRYLWVAWHWFRYNLPATQTQLLLKIEPETGEVVTQFPLPPGTQNDGTHGLAWDGTKLWHMKDSKLSSIDPFTGDVIDQYYIGEIKRPSGLAWDGQALWIAEFEGKIWRLTL